jgi:hypothetical protein
MPPASSAFSFIPDERPIRVSKWHGFRKTKTKTEYGFEQTIARHHLDSELHSRHPGELPIDRTDLRLIGAENRLARVRAHDKKAG